MSKAVFVEITILFASVFLIRSFAKDFSLNLRKLAIFIFPLVNYIIGFTLRISGNGELVDIGYFFTEFTTLFVTILFSLCIYFGQIKYWRIK